jgi:type II secretory pathway pseudopilin PulG
MKQSYLAQAGFTLVEATIVLVLIGLLLGSVLWGQELLVHGRSKMVIVQLNELSAAVEVYRDRYQAIPGDDAMAQGRWNWTAVPAAVPSSPGNGIVDGAYNQPAALPEPESRLFWWHLRQAGFVAGPTDPANASQAAQQPTNAVGGLTGVTMGTGAGTVGLTGLIVCTANVPGKIAISVDIRLDDGTPADGMVRAQRQTVPNENIGVAATSYIEDGGSYLVCKKLL